MLLCGVTGVTLEYSTTAAFLKLCSSGCVCTKSICRWTWKVPLVNAIWNQLELLVAGFVAQGLYSCSLCVHVLQRGFCFSCWISSEWTGDIHEKKTARNSQANTLMRSGLLFAVLLKQLSIFLLAKCFMAVEAAVRQGSRDPMLYF